MRIVRRAEPAFRFFHLRLNTYILEVTDLRTKVKSRETKMRCNSFVVALLLVLLQPCCAQDSSKVVPETALLSFERYTNVFFGFSFPLPPDPNLRISQLAPMAFWHRLFGLGEEKNHTAFVISARQMADRDAEQVMSAYQSIRIHGQPFAIGIIEPKSKKHDESAQWGAVYFTVIHSYLVEFEIRSLDPGIAKDLEHCVEQITFFNPAQAKEVAGPNGKPYPPLAQSQSKH
jgi:hypothetical protein